MALVDIDDPEVLDALDTAYHSKYRRYAATTLDRITSQTARDAALRLHPR